jgi:hypothetical protein
MEEIYSFTAKVVAKLKYRINIAPENPDAFIDYLERVGLPGIRYLPKGVCLISICNRKLIDATKGADRVRYSVEKRYNRLFGVKMEPLP